MSEHGARNVDEFKEAVVNNTFEMKYVEDVLQDVFHNSYNFLDNVQRQSIGLTRAAFTYSDLVPSKIPGKLYYQIDKDLIDPSFREEYRTSPYYQKLLTPDEIGNNQDIFAKIPLVFIDGYMTTKYYVKAYFDMTFIFFDFSVELRKHKNILVFFVINDGLVNGELHRYSFRNYGNKLPVSKFDDDSPWTSPFTTIEGDDVAGSSALFSSSDGNVAELEFSDSATSIINGNPELNVTVLKTRYLHVYPKIIRAYMNYDGTMRIEPFCLTDDDGDPLKMPVPVENIILFRTDAEERGNWRPCDSTIKRIYPFTYVIDEANIAESTVFRAVYFYIPISEEYSYVNHLANLQKLAMECMAESSDIPLDVIMQRLLDKPEDEVSEKWKKLLTYEPYDYQYSMDDFHAGTNHPFWFNYKVDKLCDFIRHDPWILKEYVNRQSRCNYGYELDVSTIRDSLPSRLRENTYGDLTSEHWVELSEPCYLFKFNVGAESNFELTFFIDGLYVEPVYQVTEFFTKYIYLPAEKIDATSWIDVEQNDVYEYTQDFEFLSNEDICDIVVHIPGNTRCQPLRKDIRIVDPEGYELTEYDISRGFNLTETKAGVEIDINNEEYAPIDDFQIALTGTPVSAYSKFTIIVDRSNLIGDYSSDEDPILVSLVPRVFFDKATRVRVFVKGRLIDERGYILEYFDAESAILLVRKPLEVGDKVSILLSPNHYTPLNLGNIDESGLVDLAATLNKPASVTYYDYYLNGRKLTSKEITQLTPTKIQISGVDSLRNFVIFEKDRDPIEYFGQKTRFDEGFDFIYTVEDEVLAKDSIYNDHERETMMAILYANQGKSYADRKPNTDFEDDLYADIIDDATARMMVFIFRTFYTIKHIQPDERQLTLEEIAAYSPYNDKWMKEDISGDGTKNVFHVNPDIQPAPAFITQRISSDKLYSQYKIEIQE